MSHTLTSSIVPDDRGADIQAMKAYINELEMTLLLTRLATDATTDAKRGVLHLFAGAVYDFAGFLTTRNRTIEVGSAANASDMVDLIKEWANLRGLDMATADINAWLGLLSAVRQDTPTEPRA